MTDGPSGLAAAYIRESTEEQGKGYSPDAQRVAIQQFAAANDLVIVEEYVDYHSAWRGSEDRPEFQGLMRDAADKRFSTVIVYHTSRFARDQILAKKYKRFLRENGIRIVSVTQPLGDDPSDPSAFLVESIHEMFDEFHSVTQSFWVSAGLHEKQRQGFLVGSLPWGYRRGGTATEVVLDLERASLVRELFERYATGNYSDRDLAVWLNSAGARTSKGNPFTKDTVREMLTNASYAGYVTSRRSKDTSVPGSHPAIIDLATFQRVQEIRLARTKTLHPGRPGGGYALSKLLVLFVRGADARKHGRAEREAALRLFEPQAGWLVWRVGCRSGSDRGVGGDVHSSLRSAARGQACDHQASPRSRCRSREGQTLVPRRPHEVGGATGKVERPLRPRGCDEGRVHVQAPTP